MPPVTPHHTEVALGPLAECLWFPDGRSVWVRREKPRSGRAYAWLEPPAEVFAEVPGTMSETAFRLEAATDRPFAVVLRDGPRRPAAARVAFTPGAPLKPRVVSGRSLIWDASEWNGVRVLIQEWDAQGLRTIHRDAVDAGVAGLPLQPPWFHHRAEILLTPVDREGRQGATEALRLRPGVEVVFRQTVLDGRRQVAISLDAAACPRPPDGNILRTHFFTRLAQVFPIAWRPDSQARYRISTIVSRDKVAVRFATAGEPVEYVYLGAAGPAPPGPLTRWVEVGSATPQETGLADALRAAGLEAVLYEQGGPQLLDALPGPVLGAILRALRALGPDAEAFQRIVCLALGREPGPLEFFRACESHPQLVLLLAGDPRLATLASRSGLPDPGWCRTSAALVEHAATGGAGDAALGDRLAAGGDSELDFWLNAATQPEADVRRLLEFRARRGLPVDLSEAVELGETLDRLKAWPLSDLEGELVTGVESDLRRAMASVHVALPIALGPAAGRDDVEQARAASRRAEAELEAHLAHRLSELQGTPVATPLGKVLELVRAGEVVQAVAGLKALRASLESRLPEPVDPVAAVPPCLLTADALWTAWRRRVEERVGRAAEWCRLLLENDVLPPWPCPATVHLQEIVPALRECWERNRGAAVGNGEAEAGPHADGLAPRVREVEERLREVSSALRGAAGLEGTELLKDILEWLSAHPRVVAIRCVRASDRGEGPQGG